MESSGTGWNLRGRWEAFVSLKSAELTTEAAQKEKHVRLEEFLHTFLLMSANPAFDREDLVNFCNDIHSVFNILVRNFMTDVEELAPTHLSTCSSLPSPLPQQVPVSPLMDFLMHGRGWLTLNALCSLSGQALDFNPDFVCLLVQFIDEALNLPVVSSKNKDRRIRIPKLEACIHKKNFSRKNLMTIGFSNSRRSTLRGHSFSSTASSVRHQGSRGSPHSWRKGSRDCNDSSDSDSKTSPSRRVLRKSGSDSKHVYSRQAPLPRSATGPAEVQIVDWKLNVGSSQSEVSSADLDALDLCLVLLSLLEKLCISEAMHSSRRNALALFLAPKLVNLLTNMNSRMTKVTAMEGLANDQLDNNRWSADHICTLQKLVVRIVVSLCMYSCTQHYEAPKLASSGILFTLLHLVKSFGQKMDVTHLSKETLRETQTPNADVMNEHSTQTGTDGDGGGCYRGLESPDSDWSHLSEDNLHYISEILHGVLLLLIGVVHSCCSNQIVVTHAMALLNEFDANGGYRITESLLAFVDEKIRHLGEESTEAELLKDCIVSLLCSLSKLLIATKRAKLEYLHKFQCLKRTHGNCDYSHYTHHHHSMFGISYSSYEEDKDLSSSSKILPLDAADNSLFRAHRSKCCIAVIVEMLLGLLSKVRYKSTTVRILFALEQGGICCCLPPKVVLSVLLNHLKDQPVAMRSYQLSVLGKLILEQLGGGEHTEGAIDGICEECSHQDIRGPPATSTKEIRVSNHYLSSDSAICSDGSQHDEDVHSTRWNVLELYTPLLMSEDAVLSQQISGHLLHLVRHGNMIVKEELYFNVILSCFRHSSADSIDETRKLPCFTSPVVLEHIFCSLPHLLNTLSAQVEFLVEGGLKQLVQLLDLQSTRMHVLNVFEVLISSEERQGALLESRSRSSTKDSALSTGTVSDNGDTCHVAQEFAKIVCGVLPYKAPEEPVMVKSLTESNELNEDWLQSCEVIEDPVERDVYRSTQNRNVIEEGKVAFAESLNTIVEVESCRETYDSLEEILLMPDQLSKLNVDTLMKAADIWRVGGHMLLCSACFHEHFLEREGEDLAAGLLTEALVGLTKTWRMCEGLPISWSPVGDDIVRMRAESDFKPATLNMFQVILDITGSLLRICLTLEGKTAKEEETPPGYLEVCKRILKHSGIFQSVLGRFVAEMLLKVAQMQAYVHPGSDDSGSGNKYCGATANDMLHWNLEELQEAVSSDSQSEVSDLLSTEEGYNADSERELEETHTEDSEDRAELDKAEGNYSQPTLRHPQVCLLLLDLLEGAADRGKFPAEVACYSIKQLIVIARSSQASQNSLYHSGLPGMALHNYRKSQSQAERVLLLELFAVLVQQNLATSELREFLQLFPNSPPATNDDLLSTLLSIVEGTTCAPSHVVSFPVIKPLPETLLSDESHTSSTSTLTDTKPFPNGRKTASEPSTTAAGHVHVQQLRSSKSPWSLAPVQLPLHSNFPWPPTGKGFVVSAWLKVDELSLTSRLRAVPGFKRRRSVYRQAPVKMTEEQLEDELLHLEKRIASRRESMMKPSASQRMGLHLLSVGNRDLTLQVFVDARNCKMTIRLAHSAGNSEEVLYETTCANLLSLAVWQHLAIGYEEKAEGLTRTGTISVLVNGQIQKDIIIEYTSPGQTKHSLVPCCLLLGHCIQKGTVTSLPHGSWQLGNVLLFNDARILTQEVAFHLFTMGPDCVTISSCEGSRQSRLYSQYITQDVLHSALSTEIMSGDREVDLRPARESLVVSYSPSNRDVFSLYEATSQSSSTLGRVLGGQSRSYSNALLQCPTTVGVRLLCSVNVQANRGLQQALKESGGIGVFVFLFAKIVENCSCKLVQAKALKLLFKLRSCCHTLAAEFNDMAAASMISQVLVTPKCSVGFEMLKVMLDACLSKPVLYLCAQTNGYRIHCDTLAIIQDTGLVSRLLLDWRVWEKSEHGVLQTLFSVVETLIHPDHPYQAFNRTQLLSIRCVQTLLMICEERHHEDLPSLTPSTCSSIVSIIKNLMGHPPDANLLAEVGDFLMVMHPAVNTFVCHAQSSFYFSQHSFSQQQNKQELLRRMSMDFYASNSSIWTQSDSASFYLPGDDSSSMESNYNRQKSMPTPDRDNAVNATISDGQRPTSPGASEDKVSDMSGLCSGLLHLLAEALISLPNTSLPKVLGIVLKPETLIVLAHHESPLIRTRVIQLIDVFFKRASLSQIEGFLKRRGFHLLANQLHQYPTTREIMEACLTITVGKPVHLSQGLELMLLQDPDQFQNMSSVLITSLLENAAHDFSLCHDGICIANQLFEGVESIPSIMLGNGLVETLCNLLSAVCSNLAMAYSAQKRYASQTSLETGRRSSSRNSGTSTSTSIKIAATYNVDTTEDQNQLTLPGDDRVKDNPCQDPSKESSGEEEETKPQKENETRKDEGSASQKELESAVQPQQANGFVAGCHQEQDKLEEKTDAERIYSVGSFDRLSFTGLDRQASRQDSPLPSPGADMEISEEALILIKDIQHFMACIANRVFSSSNHFDYFENMMLLLGGLEEKLKAKYGAGSLISDIVYETQCYIFKEVLDHFRATSKSVESAVTRGKKALSMQRSVSYSERKYEEYKWKRSQSLDSFSKVSGSRKRFPSFTSSIDTVELGLSFISESSAEDIMTLSSEQDQMSDVGLQALDRRYSAQLDTVLRMQRVQASSTSSRPPSRRRTPEMAGEQLLAKRFQRMCLLTVNLVVQRDPGRMRLFRSATSAIAEDCNIPPLESTFVQLSKRLFHLLSAALAATMERKLGQRKQWESILWSSRDTLRLQLHRLLVHMMGPWQPASVRVYVLQVAGIPRANHILQTVLNSNMQQHLGKFELFLYDLFHNHAAELSDANSTMCQQLMEVLEECGFHPLYQEDMDTTSRERVKLELEKRVVEERSAQVMYTKQRLDGAITAWTKLDPFAKEVANSAMEVTQLVAAYQNGQRLRFLDFLKSTIANSMDVRSAWQDLIQSLTHERAVWYDPKTYPSSWQLDPTEGPGRVRRRLQRCHLYIPGKFLLPHRQRNYQCQPPVPLGYLFQDPRHSSDSSEFKKRLQKNEKISFAYYCKLVNPASVIKGDLLQGVNSMYFVSEEEPEIDSQAQVKPFERDMMTISWLYEDIKELHLRWYQLRDHALEIFLTNGQTLLLAFESTKERDTLYQQIKSCDLPNLIEVEDISAVTQAWRLGQMTNYEYLTQLNKLAGRSFNDLMQYPVFPFVLCDYTSKVLDLENPDSYRDLARPVAVQTNAMESKYKETYKFLKEEYQKLKGIRLGQTMFWTKPYHYGSHYSNSGTVLQYLVRLPPFTQMFLHYQDNHFDLPDRTFHSVDTSWRLSSFQSSTDVKELIPEFFFLPEFLVNNEGFNFGVRQSGVPVDNVMLPPWAKGSARLFMYIHKQALESTYVSKYLHTWVDLVFGVKQQGPLAVESVNVFHPATYFGIDTTIIKDPVKQRAVETMIKTYGQTPKQLFVNYHPSRLEPDIFPDSFAMGSVGILASLSQRQATKFNTGPEASYISGPVNTVLGMRWGNYVGSASGSTPVIRFQKHYPVPLTALVPLPTGDVCGVAQDLCLFLMYSKEKGVSSMNAIDIKWSGIVSWGHPDSILRVQVRRKSPPINLLHATPTDKITCCTSVSDCRLLFIGTESGGIKAYPTRYNPEKQCNIEVVGTAVRLFGHTARVNSLCVCRPYSVMVSASEDGSCIIWDINRLSYVRSLCNDSPTSHRNGVTTVAVSDVSGDIAIATRSVEGTSDVSLWTINASLVTRRLCDSRVLCLAFSNAAEGVAVNTLVAGCEDGQVRFWSTIDFTSIRVLVGSSQSPIISLTFTNDSQFLLASNQDGQIMAWGNKETNRRMPKIEVFLGTGKDRSRTSSSNS